MRQITDILYRLRRGESARMVSRHSAHHRATITRYQHLAQQCGLLDPERALPTEAELLAILGEPSPAPHPCSTIAPYAALVTEWLKNGVEIRTMHRLLCAQYGYRGSYGSVLRFVRRNHPVSPETFVRIETAPGEEAQVDFGTAGKLIDPASGKARTAYCFVMTLSASRHQYVEFVFDQKIATFLGCHKRAFESFGGVVKRVVVDNLKAAVLKHAMEDPVLCAPYQRMAQHYGFLIHACRPRTPEHKGKVESGVHYVKRNLWPEVAGGDLQSANRAAKKWVADYAGLRTHGTTHKQPITQFIDIERRTLLALPEHAFTFERLLEVTVHSDCHVTVENNYYSAPHTLVGKKLEAHLYEGTVQLYDGVQLIVTHERSSGRGERVTRGEHYPHDKRIYLERTPEHCLKRAREVGKSCSAIAVALASERPRDNRRALCCLIGLLDRYPAEHVEAACRRAVACGDPRYMRVRMLLASTVEAAPFEEAAAPPDVATYRFARSAQDFFAPSEARKEGERPC